MKNQKLKKNMFRPSLFINDRYLTRMNRNIAAKAHRKTNGNTIEMTYNRFIFIAF